MGGVEPRPGRAPFIKLQSQCPPGSTLAGGGQNSNPWPISRGLPAGHSIKKIQKTHLGTPRPAPVAQGALEGGGQFSNAGPDQVLILFLHARSSTAPAPHAFVVRVADDRPRWMSSGPLRPTLPGRRSAVPGSPTANGEGRRLWQRRCTLLTRQTSSTKTSDNGGRSNLVRVPTMFFSGNHPKAGVTRTCRTGGVDTRGVLPGPTTRCSKSQPSRRSRCGVGGSHQSTEGGSQLHRSKWRSAPAHLRTSNRPRPPHSRGGSFPRRVDGQPWTSPSPSTNTPRGTGGEKTFPKRQPARGPQAHRRHSLVSASSRTPDATSGLSPAT